MAAELGVPFAILNCQASQSQLRQRVTDRNKEGNEPSEANIAVLERQLAGHEPLDSDERVSVLDIHAGADQQAEFASGGEKQKLLTQINPPFLK